MKQAGPDPDALNTYSFETPRLLIDLPDESDVADIHGLVGGADRSAICSTLVWDGPEDRSEVEGWVEGCRSETYGRWGFHWVIRDRLGGLTGAFGTVVGAIGTRPLETPGRADVGYWLGRAYWRLGLMSEALAGLVDLGASRLSYAKMEAYVFTANIAGRRLVERTGFELEGIIRRAVRKQGEWIDEALYGLVLDPG